MSNCPSFPWLIECLWQHRTTGYPFSHSLLFHGGRIVYVCVCILDFLRSKTPSLLPSKTFFLFFLGLFSFSFSLLLPARLWSLEAMAPLLPPLFTAARLSFNKTESNALQVALWSADRGPWFFSLLFLLVFFFFFHIFADRQRIAKQIYFLQHSHVAIALPVNSLSFDRCF